MSLLSLLVVVAVVFGCVYTQVRLWHSVIDGAGKAIAALLLWIFRRRRLRSHRAYYESYEFRDLKLILEESQRLLEQEIDEYYQTNPN